MKTASKRFSTIAFNLFKIVEFLAATEVSAQVFVKKFEGWKGLHLCGRPWTALSLATPLSTALSNQLNYVGILSQKM